MHLINIKSHLKFPEDRRIINSMNIQISDKIMGELIGYCRAEWPLEACGAIFGRRENDMEVTRFVPLINIAEDPQQQFLIKADQWVDVIYGKQSADRCIGVAHSHPHSPAVPSADDLQSLWYDFPSYWIVSFDAELKSYVEAYAVNFASKQPRRLTIILQKHKP